MQKRNRFGIHAKIESNCLELLCLAIEVAFEQKQNKKIILEKSRIKIEVLKHLIRISNSIGCIDKKTYIRFENDLIEISKMAHGWINYLTQKEF